MYKGFDLSIDDISILSSGDDYTKRLQKSKNAIKTKFNELLLNDGKIDAEKLKADWFPSSNEYHVFISHSHEDLELAEKLANWLYETFGLKSFLDSHIWHYANDLLQQLNDKYALHKSQPDVYQYQPAIANASHVHLMLSTALSEIIDKSECLFFLNTNNALDDVDISNGMEVSRTASPWIMHELKTSSMIRRHKPRLVIKGESMNKSYSLENIDTFASFLHHAPLDHLIKIGQDDLSQWKSECSEADGSGSLFSCLNPVVKSKTTDALDKLYSMME